MLFQATGDEKELEGADTMIAIDPQIAVPRGALPRRELARFLRAARESIALAGEVSVLLTTDARMRELNRSFRGKNKPTDVLSFPAFALQGSAPRLAGDVAVSLETAQRQADEHGHSLAEEVRILLLHGLLHLAGFDHEQDTGQMEHRERELRRQFALPQGLIQRAAPPSARIRGAAR